MEKKIKILGIAPYEALRMSMERIGRQQRDMSVRIFLGNMKDGLEIAKFHENDNYDVIISRGATARLIKEKLCIPVITVNFSPFDILRAMNVAETYSGKYAIVGFSSITKSTRILCDLLHKDAEIITIYHEEDTEAVIRDLKNRGYSTVICGTVGADYAKRLGLFSVLILSGDECVEAAFDQALEMSQGYSYMRERKTVYEHILGEDSKKLLLFNSDKQVYFSSWDKKNGNIEEILRRELDKMPPNGVKKVQAIKNTLYSMEGRWMEAEGNQYGLFQLQEEKIPLGSERRGFFYLGKNQAEHDYHNSIYGISGAIGLTEDQIQMLITSSHPVVITSEELPV